MNPDFVFDSHGNMWTIEEWQSVCPEFQDKPRFVGRMRQHSKDIDANNIEYGRLAEEQKVGSLTTKH